MIGAVVAVGCDVLVGDGVCDTVGSDVGVGVDADVSVGAAGVGVGAGVGVRADSRVGFSVRTGVLVPAVGTIEGRAGVVSLLVVGTTGSVVAESCLLTNGLNSTNAISASGSATIAPTLAMPGPP